MTENIAVLVEIDGYFSLGRAQAGFLKIITGSGTASGSLTMTGISEVVKC